MLCGVVPVQTPAVGSKDQIEDGINGKGIKENLLAQKSMRL